MLIKYQDLVKKYGVFDNVLHLGANTGQELPDYYNNGVKKSIWVEAIPNIYQQLQENCSKYPNAIALGACLSNIDGQEVEFHVANNEGQSSSFLELGTHKEMHPSVVYTDSFKINTKRVDTLLEKNNIFLDGNNWFGNLDLQGAEKVTLLGMENLLKHFRMLYIEINIAELYIGCPLEQEIDEFLQKHGFIGVERVMTGFNWGDKAYLKL